MIIGLIIKTNMDIDPVRDVIAALSKNQKHELIFNHQSPPLKFSSTFSHGCNRRFSLGLAVSVLSTVKIHKTSYQACCSTLQ